MKRKQEPLHYFVLDDEARREKAQKEINRHLLKFVVIKVAANAAIVIAGVIIKKKLEAGVKE